jgi:hypothetical protein
VVEEEDDDESSGVAHANPAMSSAASTAVLIIEIRLNIRDLPSGLLVQINIAWWEVTATPAE